MIAVLGTALDSMKRTSAALVTIVLLTVQGSRPAQISPETLYGEIEQRFISGDLAKAEGEATRSGHVIQASSPLWRARFRVQQAKIRVYEGSPGAVALLVDPIPADLHDSTLEIRRSSLLAIAYTRSGQLERARQVLASAEETCVAEVPCADIRLSRGIIDVEQGELLAAQHAFELCLASARTSGDRFEQIQALINLGVVAERQERYEDALDLLNQASIGAGALGNRLFLEKTRGSMGWAFYKLGDYRRALENSQLAEQQAAHLGVSIDRVEWLNNAGLSQFRLGDLNAARSSYQQSYALARSLRNDEEAGDALVALGYLSLQTGDPSDALNKSHEALRLAQSKGDRDDRLEPLLIEAMALEQQGQASAAKARLLALEQEVPSGDSVQWETEHALAKLSIAAGERLAAETWFRRAIQTFRVQRSSLSSIDSRLPFFENGSALYLDYMEQLIRLDRTNDALAVLDQSRAETLAEGLGLSPGTLSHDRLRTYAEMSPQTLARQLHGTILVYCLRPGTSYLWAISSARSAFFRLPGRERILPLVAAHTAAILSSRDLLSQSNAPGVALYQALVEPARTLIAPHGKVFLIADDALNGLNFETLLAPGAVPHFWIEDADVINARSISLLAASRFKRPHQFRSKRLLLVGNPVYARPEYAPLPHASLEMARVADHFSPARRVVLDGAEATPAAYQQSHPESFAYIHFVAHASVSELSPLDSAVVLSGAPATPEAYRLYARSILDQPLGADLVTLSACYGSGVRSYSGEGLIGLAWAFLHSGSHHVIGALWEISDLSTPQLMSDMYDSLAAGNPPDRALRSAKLAMIHGSGVFRKPFYWAAFQLYSGA